MSAQSYRQTTDLAALSKLDLLTYVFGAAGSANGDEDTPVLIDAEDPSRSLSINQARVLVRKIVAGLKAFGLKQGDTVCIHATNSVSISPAPNFPFPFNQQQSHKSVAVSMHCR